MGLSNAELAGRLPAAIVAADLDAMRSIFTPDVVWHVAGRGPLAASHAGISAVIGMFGRVYEMADGTLTYDVHDVLADDSHAVVLLTAHMRVGDRDVSDKAVLVCHVRDRRISEVWEFNWAQYDIDAAMTEVIVRSARLFAGGIIGSKVNRVLLRPECISACM
jgi:uncharacterized protein